MYWIYHCLGKAARGAKILLQICNSNQELMEHENNCSVGHLVCEECKYLPESLEKPHILTVKKRELEFLGLESQNFWTIEKSKKKYCVQVQ